MGLKIIGAGLGRTGTASLKVALEQLGIGKCYHMGEVFQNLSHVDMWTAAADGRPDWDALLDGYTAAVDYPACSFWQELADRYPDAKVLLSTRDSTSWFESTHATIMAPRFNDYIAKTPFGEMIKKVIWDTLDGRMGDREFMTSYFDRRNEEIREAIAPDRLLVYEVKQGWGPLCDFFDLPVPDSQFPHINTREETAELLGKMIAGGEGELDEDLMSDLATDLFETETG